MLFRLIEFVLLFLVLPTLSALELIPFILLFLITLFWCLCVLLFDRTFDKTQFWNQAAILPQLKRILIIYVLSCLMVSFGIYLYDEKLLFIYVREIPLVWMLLMIIYSLFFVYPQELVYRTFFFHRYKKIFPNHLMMIGASAIVFSYMHIVFQNVVAIGLTLAGGMLFAKTYYESKSTFAASLEHALYGCFVFTAGLHSYFIPFNRWIVDRLFSIHSQAIILTKTIITI